MRTRSRNNALIFACLLFFVALWAVSPDAPLTVPEWDWRAVSDGPTDGIGAVGAEGFSPVRVVGAPSDVAVRTTAELLWSAGLLGVRIGPPSSVSSAASEVWVLPDSADCSVAGAALDHVARGGALISWSHCEELFLGLGAPPLVSYEGSPGQTAFAPARDGDGPIPLPLPAKGSEFAPSGMGSWRAVVTRAGGRPVVSASADSALFSIDFSAWLRSLRQGDPRLSGQDTDGIHGPKPNDLRPFPWASPVWKQPTATVWTEVLVAEVSRLAEARGGALPRVWTLPSPAASALILTSDQDFAEPSWMDSMLARTEEQGGEMSLLTTAGTRQHNSDPPAEGGGQFLSERALSEARAWGHGFGMHPNAAGLASESDQVQAIRSSYERTSALLGEDPRVVRNHYLVWWDAEKPMALYAALGLWMELNYVSIGPEFDGPGFLFGSARPARFVGSEATLPVLSQATQIEDDVLTGDFAYSSGLSSAGAVAASGRLLDVAVRHRVPLVANLHPLWVVEDRAELLDGLLDAAKSRGLPIVSAERWATQSWHRLRLVMDVELEQRQSDGDTGARWAVVPGSASSEEPEVPQWLWTPQDGSCATEHRPSVLSAGGCLTLWSRPSGSN